MQTHVGNPVKTQEWEAYMNIGERSQKTWASRTSRCDGNFIRLEVSRWFFKKVHSGTTHMFKGFFLKNQFGHCGKWQRETRWQKRQPRTTREVQSVKTLYLKRKSIVWFPNTSGLFSPRDRTSFTLLDEISWHQKSIHTLFCNERHQGKWKMHRCPHVSEACM